MHLVNKGIDPVHLRLDFLDKAVENGSLYHIVSIYPLCFLILKFTLE